MARLGFPRVHGPIARTGTYLQFKITVNIYLVNLGADVRAAPYLAYLQRVGNRLLSAVRSSNGPTKGRQPTQQPVSISSADASLRFLRCAIASQVNPERRRSHAKTFVRDPSPSQKKAVYTRKKAIPATSTIQAIVPYLVSL